MRTSKVWQIVLACLAVYGVSLPLSAQEPGKVAPPPPRLEKLEEGSPPTVTIRKPESEQQINEKRAAGGKVTEVKVKSGKSTYYLKPNDAAGSALAGDAESNSIRAAQWQVGEFDSSSDQNAKKKAERAKAASAVVPPPAPSSPAKK